MDVRFTGEVRAITRRTPSARAFAKKRLVHQPGQSLAAVIWVDAHEVDVAQVRVRLRHEADEECDGSRVAISVHDERKRGEMLEEEARQQVAHLAAAPPVIDLTDQDVVVRRCGRAKDRRFVSHAIRG